MILGRESSHTRRCAPIEVVDAIGKGYAYAYDFICLDENSWIGQCPALALTTRLELSMYQAAHELAKLLQRSCRC
jgi:hypothetical protein